MKITIREEGKYPVPGEGVGVFFEDLNYSLDGGLYAEMLENRNFEAKDVRGERDRFTIENDGSYGWTPTGEGVALKIKWDRPLFIENPHYLRLTVQKAGEGVKNKAYDGIYLQKGMGYTVSFYARSYDYRKKLWVGVFDGGKAVLAKKVRLRADGNWHRYEFHLKSRTELDRASFEVRMTEAGAIHLDCFSMMPDNAVKGIFRRDLAELVRDLKPKFVRFPGGCVVEGNTLENRYLWKRSVGQKERRRHNWNRWAVHGACAENNFRTPFSHYGQTLGVGFYEYFLLCECLGAKPLPVVGMGIACQFMSSECVPVDDPKFEVFIQDALDLVEFANGGADTVWGKVRAEMGHPKPFGLEYIGIGNEQWEENGNEFYKRFELFEKRVHEKYPSLKIIGTVGPTVDTPTHRSAWEWTKENLAKNPDFVYASDEHFYVSPEWLYSHAAMYDGYPSNCRVYAGEYAAHAAGPDGTIPNGPQANVWEGALAEAAFMTGMERNSDVVVMSSYAPLFGRLGYSQWSPDLIWFDGKRSFATVNYYVQQLFSIYTGNVVLNTEAEGGLFASATELEGLVYVKVVNPSDKEAEAEFEGDFDFGELTRIIRMAGDPAVYNTADEPERLVPEDVAPASPRSLTLPPHSFHVLIFHK